MGSPRDVPSDQTWEASSGPRSGRYLPPMPYRTPSPSKDQGLFLRFPYLNPEASWFRRPLARVAAGERLEIPTGSLFGFVQWGVTVSQDVTWPPTAPITGRDGELSARSGPVGASGPPGKVQIHLPERTITLPDGGSVTLGARLYYGVEWRGLDTASTLGYETTWRSELPPAGDVLESDAMPASGGTVGVYVRPYGVRIILAFALVVAALAAVLAAGYGIYWLAATSPGLLLGPGTP